MGGIILNFVVGGTVTALIVGLEESGQRIWSGLAALVPVFTLVSYFFIGASKNAIAVSQHSKFVLVGTLVSWVPYMAAVALLAPRVGGDKTFKGPFPASRPPLWAPLRVWLRISGLSSDPFLPL